MSYMMFKSQIQSQWFALTNYSKIPWWIEIRTALPYCIYFFGPFDNFNQAKRERDGYIEDIVAEKAFGITVEIKRCQPNSLTIFEESESTSGERLENNNNSVFQ